ncbi:hypothetical protein EJ02DRAFT_161855 [Clathrospora elynae]|uniref:Uncharacterized protein n=1 Tax=Clathrospora elynae TaxID=706981 RepID=A0A6A5S3V7_9PLEO|nr:hypothetical protein EJ02DRAFT_161855 [Clathrospora elynae]
MPFGAISDLPATALRWPYSLRTAIRQHDDPSRTPVLHSPTSLTRPTIPTAARSMGLGTMDNARKYIRSTGNPSGLMCSTHQVTSTTTVLSPRRFRIVPSIRFALLLQDVPHCPSNPLCREPLLLHSPPPTYY